MQPRGSPAGGQNAEWLVAVGPCGRGRAVGGMKARLEAIANMVVIAVALAVGYTLLRGNLVSSAANRGAGVGDYLPAVTGIDWGRHGSTLVLALNSSCHYCRESAPFYRKLAQARVTGPDRDLDMIALFQNDSLAVRSFNTQLGLSIRSFSDVALEKLNIVATPTLFLVDRKGRVDRAWVGVLTPRQEHEVLELASAGIKTRRQ